MYTTALDKCTYGKDLFSVQFTRTSISNEKNIYIIGTHVHQPCNIIKTLLF